MNIGPALSALDTGKIITRMAWHGRSYVKKFEPITQMQMTMNGAELNAMHPESVASLGITTVLPPMELKPGEVVKYVKYLINENKSENWTPTADDMAAEDWIVR